MLAKTSTPSHRPEAKTSDPKPLRGMMPEITAWIDDLRSAFGPETIEAAIKAGIAGEPVFFAVENGIEVGTRSPSNENAWSCTSLTDRSFCSGCSGECVGTATRCSMRAGKSATST